MALTPEVKQLSDQLVALIDSYKRDVTNLSAKHDRLRAKFERPHPGSPGERKDIMSFETVGSRFVKEVDLDLLRKGASLRWKAGYLLPTQMKLISPITDSGLGFATPGMVGADTIEPGITGLPRRRLMARDLWGKRQVGTGQVQWAIEASFTNAASPQTEGSAKEESTFSLTMQSEKVQTIAHFVNASRQVLDDVPGLTGYINNSLVYYLLQLTEWEELFGDGSGTHLHGVCHQATAYAGTYTAAGDTVLDSLRHYATELEMLNETCNFYVLNPRDVERCDLAKTDDGGTNKGLYIASSPVGGVVSARTYWGRPVVSTTVMPQGKCLAGDANTVLVGERQGATIDVSFENGTNFEKNLVTLRGELRESLVCLRPAALRYGNI